MVFPTAILIRIDLSPANLLLLKYVIKLIGCSQHLNIYLQITDEDLSFPFANQQLHNQSHTPVRVLLSVSRQEVRQR